MSSVGMLPYSCMARFRLLVVATLFVVGSPAPPLRARSPLPAVALAQAGGDLVVSIPGDKEFHQPGCPLVAKAGSNVKVMKRAEALRRKLTPHAGCSAAQGTDVAGDPNAVKVYTQPGDNKYHTATCRKLGAQRVAVTLEEAGRKWWPCPVCKPPVRQRTTR
jgi:hypothetical protein